MSLMDFIQASHLLSACFYWQLAASYCSPHLNEDTAMLSSVYTIILEVFILSWLFVVGTLLQALFFVFLSFCFAVTPLYPHESIELNLIYTVAAKFAHSPRHLSRKQIVVWGKLMKVLVESSNTPTNFPPGKIHFVSLSTKLLSFWKKNNFKTHVVLNVKGSIFCQKLACAFCVWMVFTFIQEWIDDTI